MTHRYDDIINLPHHVSQKHAPMARADRAAQFSPFAALTGSIRNKLPLFALPVAATAVLEQLFNAAAWPWWA